MATGTVRSSPEAAPPRRLTAEGHGCWSSKSLVPTQEHGHLLHTVTTPISSSVTPSLTPFRRSSNFSSPPMLISLFPEPCALPDTQQGCSQCLLNQDITEYGIPASKSE